MKENINSITLPLTDRIKSNRNAIFCGAGISYNSGLPLANSLITQILKALDVEEQDIALLQGSKLPFEAFIQTLTDEVEVDAILEIFERGEPNPTHEFIAELIKTGYVTAIMTTNFDQLIEKSLEKLGLKNELHYKVYSKEEEFSEIDWGNTEICKIIKIHGCVSDKLSMAITLGEVAKKTIGQYRAKAVNSFFSSSIHTSVLVCGYSCSDIFDISPQLEQMQSQKSEIHFLDHVFGDNGFYVESISLKKENNPFQLFEGHRYYANTDFIVKDLSETLFNRELVFKKANIEWIEKIKEWILQAIEYSYGIKHHITGRMLYDIGEYQRAISKWNQGIVFAQQERNMVFFYALMGNLGMAYNAFGKYSLAKSCLEESVQSCEQLGNTQGLIAQSQALGNVYRNLADYKKAIEIFKKTITIAKNNREIYGLCSSYGNLANVYVQLKSPDETIEVLKEGIPIALISGNKQFEGSMKCNLGVAYSQKGDFQKANYYVEESLVITRSIGDRQGECLALINLSNIALSVGQLDRSFVIAESALGMAISIGTVQNEGGANYNMGCSLFLKKEFDKAIPYLKRAVNIYSEIYGSEHSHFISASKTLAQAEANILTQQ